MSDLEERFKTSGLCPSCFSPNGGKGTCPVCGYKSTDSSDQEWNRLKPGAILHGRYVVGRPLGHGGFGITYLGLDMLLETRLAIKEYYPSSLAIRNPSSRTVMSSAPGLSGDFHKGMEKFLEEARTLARFGAHPHIVTVSDFFQENGTAYMVMAYLEGRTLQKHLEERGGKISFEETMKILSPIMDALDEIHASGMIHRDISPDNIFVTDSGHVRLLDFGAAKTALALMSQQSHSVVLKRGYSPAEQYQSRGSLGPWTDIYSMAATIYRCITGSMPPDPMDRLEKEVLVPPSEMGVVIREEAELSILKAMSLSSSTRPQSMREFKEGLLGLNVSLPGDGEASVKSPRSVNVKTPPSGLEKKHGDHAPAGQAAKKPFPVLLAAIGVLVLIGAGVFFYQSGSADKSGENAVAEFTEDAVTDPTGPALSTLESLKQKAEKGDPESQYLLGEKYYKGDGVSQDYAEAAKWYKKAAEQGNSDAQFSLGVMYANGLGVAKNEAEASKWYKKAEKQGNQNAVAALKRMEEKETPSQVIQPQAPSTSEFRALCRKGTAKEVQQAIDKGTDVNASDEKTGATALMWAAGYGKHPDVLTALIKAGAAINARDKKGATALMWAASNGQNPELYTLLIKLGADKNLKDKEGNTATEIRKKYEQIKEAQELLNDLGYKAGTPDGQYGSRTQSAVKSFQGSAGIARDGKITDGLVKLLREAKENPKEKANEKPTEKANEIKAAPDSLGSLTQKAENGDPKSQYLLAKKYLDGDGVIQDDVLAAKLLQKASENGFADAQIELGNIYSYGRGMSQNYTEALKWYRKAAEQGNPDAQNNLGLAYEFGEGVKKNDTEAAKWYKKAAEQGHADAQYKLGWMYEEGQGVTQNYVEAFKWFRKAAVQGDEYAQYHLGLLYQTGQGVHQSSVDALIWYTQAADQGLEMAKSALKEMGK